MSAREERVSQSPMSPVVCSVSNFRFRLHMRFDYFLSRNLGLVYKWNKAGTWGQNQALHSTEVAHLYQQNTQPDASVELYATRRVVLCIHDADIFEILHRATSIICGISSIL